MIRVGGERRTMSEPFGTVAAPSAIQTARLHLRPPVEGDAAAIAEVANDWELASRLARLPHPYRVEDAHWFIANIVPVEIVWAIQRRADRVLMGIIGLTPGRPGQAELGYWLGRRYWGSGFMTEAASHVVAYGFELLRLQVLTTSWFKESPASGRVLEKLGFQQVRYGERLSSVSEEPRPAVEMKLEFPTPVEV
jgi:RimJ/RimL family protein N-acetyltransferase